MLYPDFNELVSLKDRKSSLVHTSRRSLKSIVSGNHHSPFRGQGLEFDAVREYVPGDDIRTIDWRVTARTGAPHVKLFKEERERHIVICVDMNTAMRFGTKKTFKSIQAARIAALLGWRGLAQNDSISACLFGDVPDGIRFFPPKRTRTSFCAMLKMLTQPLEERHDISINRALQHISRVTQTGSLVYFISDFMDIEQEFQTGQLTKKCDVVCIAVNDRADQSLAPVGTLACLGEAGDKLYVNTENNAGREAYNKLWKENRQRLYQMTSKSNIPLVELTTESEVHRDLLLGLKSIVKRKK